MRNKRGESTISVCVMIVILCMILSVLITFVGAISVAKMTEQNSRVVLDNYVMRNSILIYDSIKQGNDKNQTLDASSYVNELTSFCTFAEIGGYLYNIDSKGQEQFRITIPQMGYTTDKTLKIYVSYTVYVPIYFAGIRVTTAQIPIKIVSKFNKKN